MRLPTIITPDADGLVAALAATLGPDDLRCIAAADYGDDADEHHAGLCRIAAGDMSHPLRWCPHEVLALTRWEEPEAARWGADYLPAHRRRAFACAALLRAFGNTPATMEGPDFDGSNQTLIQLIASLRELGDAFDRAAAAFLQWLIPNIAEQAELAFYGLGLLWFALAPSVGASDKVLLALADWTMWAEDAVAGQWRESLGAGATGGWLLSLTVFDQRHHVWRQFGAWLAARAADRSPAVLEACQLIAAALLEPKRLWR